MSKKNILLEVVFGAAFILLLYIDPLQLHIYIFAQPCAFAKSCWHFIMSSLSLSVPFLLVTVLLPVFCIILLLIKNPIAEYRTPFSPTRLSITTFYICLSLFLLLHIYGIYYYKLRLQWEGAAEIINFSSHTIFDAPLPDHGLLRFAYILTNLILLPCFALHLPLTTIAVIYCLYNACFHLFIAFAILFFTRRYDLATVILAAPMLIVGINFYFINNELYLSGSIMILYMAIYKGLKDGALKNLILLPCLFFIIWSHPISIIMLAVFLAGMYKSVGQLIKDKWILAFMLLNLGGRILLFTAYDHAHITELNRGPDFTHLVSIIIEYCAIYWYIIVLLAASIYFFITDRKNISDYAGLLIFPVLLYFSTVKMLDTDIRNFSKFMYPVNLFILMLGITTVTVYAGRYRKLVWAGTCVMLCSGIYGIVSYHPFFMKRAHLIEVLNNICHSQDPDQSKWYISGAPLDRIDKYGTSTESIPFSAYQKLPNTIQLVWPVSPRLKKALDIMPEDLYFVCEDSPGVSTQTIKSLNPYYFNFKKGPYKELILDSAKMNTIRKVCQ